jgi:hypothetical protein
MNNFTGSTWMGPLMGQELEKVIKSFVQYPPRKLQSEGYTGPIASSVVKRLTKSVSDSLNRAFPVETTQWTQSTSLGPRVSWVIDDYCAASLASCGSYREQVVVLCSGSHFTGPRSISTFSMVPVNLNGSS